MRLQLLDIYAPAVTALAAPASGAWLRSVLAHARTKVLLLQSPALLALYSTGLRDADLQRNYAQLYLPRRCANTSARTPTPVA